MEPDLERVDQRVLVHDRPPGRVDPARRSASSGPALRRRSDGASTRSAGRAGSRCPIVRAARRASGRNRAGRCRARAVWMTSMSKPSARWATARAIRPKPTSPSVAPCTSRARCVPNPHPVHRPSRRSRSASEARRVAARISRNARSAVVSSSTPGVLQTVMPMAVRRGDVDVVVAHGRVRHDAQPPVFAPTPARPHRCDRSGGRRSRRIRRPGADELLGREGGAVLAQHDLMAGFEQRVCPALGQGAGDEDASHLVGRVVDGARTLDADGEAEAVDWSVVADRAQ